MNSNNYEEIDFAQLALQDSNFAKVLKHNGQLDFSSPESVKQLTKALLMRDFGLKIELPDDRLCPPVPNRLNYLLWIQALLDTTSESFSDSFDPRRQVLGLDIGTGASCIYPLLGCSQRPQWRFAGTDIDEKSLQIAEQNIGINKLNSRIRLHESQPNAALLPLDELGFQNIDFSMCNPPFYESKAEMLSSAAFKNRPPFTACTGSETEMVTPGGEVAFVSRMIAESLDLQDRVQWYTSLLGKFSSLPMLLQKLKEHDIGNYAVTEFVQGSKTRRWGIAWSHDDLRPSMSVARGVSNLSKAALPFPSEYTITFQGTVMSSIALALDRTLSELSLLWTWRAQVSTGVGFAENDVWSRSARRLTTAKSRRLDTDDDPEMTLGFKIRLEDDAGNVKLIIRWLKGQDSVLFESFCGMVKRKVGEATK